MTTLSVNVNKLATLRNARGKNTPNVLQMTFDMIQYGAQGITVHPRPDGRHIRKDDVYAIANAIDVEFNIEGYPSPDFLELVLDVCPAQCTLVPDPPGVLTSNAGWNVCEQADFLTTVVQRLQTAGIRTSLFVDPYRLETQDMDALLTTRTDRVELYTEAYADAYSGPLRNEVIARYRDVAEIINGMGIGLNAGHDLNLENLSYFVEFIPWIQEVSIGHALVCDALYLGMQETIVRYLKCLGS